MEIISNQNIVRSYNIIVYRKASNCFADTMKIIVKPKLIFVRLFVKYDILNEKRNAKLFDINLMCSNGK